MPASYGIHPVLNSSHLEPYHVSDPTLGERPIKNLSRADFEAVLEFEVETIIAERWKHVRNGRRVQELLTPFTGYDSSFDEWLTWRQLKNAPECLREWDHCNEGVSPH